ncbi:hypothetical protein Tco_0692698, partial [Tanacetum coccineum]
EFDEEPEQVAGEVHGNDDDDNPLGSLQVVLIESLIFIIRNPEKSLLIP